MAIETLRAVKDCLFEDEHRIAYEEFYFICKQNLEAYEIEVDRMRQRMRPSEN
jgi:hypothetical protein